MESFLPGGKFSPRCAVYQRDRIRSFRDVLERRGFIGLLCVWIHTYNMKILFHPIRIITYAFLIDVRWSPVKLMLVHVQCETGLWLKRTSYWRCHAEQLHFINIKSVLLELISYHRLYIIHLCLGVNTRHVNHIPWYKYLQWHSGVYITLSF